MFIIWLPVYSDSIGPVRWQPILMVHMISTMTLHDHAALQVHTQHALLVFLAILGQANPCMGTDVLNE